MNLRIFCTSIALLFFVHTHAQLEASIWYFGYNAGLDFRSGTPVALEDGALYTEEGCATISDPSGNLLFYTNGITVWDRNHQIMPNGTGLLGNFSATQSAIIVPKPNDSNIYYVFTVTATAYIHGLNYNEVDMRLNGGLGDVAVKNVSLQSPVSEKITAVEHDNARDIWVIAHDWGNADFLAYLITPAGINTTPVVSTVGMDLSTSLNNTNAIGYMKVSPDGTKLALSHRDEGSELLDFDPATGMVSNPIRLTTADLQYGVEFSPNGQVLYLSSFNHTIFQYDLNAVDIPASAVQINQNNVGEAAMQLAIDGKIYVTNFHTNSLTVIHDPNVLGPGCNYEYAAVNLGTGRSFWGLPPFIQSFFLVNFESNNLCFGDTTEFNISASEPIVSILWDFGDGNTSTDENAAHIYAAPGNYTVNVTVTTASETRTETKDITIYEQPMANPVIDLDVCHPFDTYDLDLTTLDAQVLGAQPASDFGISYFASQTDADNNTNPLNAITHFGIGSTMVYARVSNLRNSSCYDTTGFVVEVNLEPMLAPVNDWTVCDDDTDGLYIFDLTTRDAEIINGQDTAVFSVSYHGSQADADNGTNDLGASHTNTLALETLFFRIENSAHPDCFETGSFAIEVIEQVVANLPTDLEICDPDNDGNASFDLSQVAAEVIGAQNPASLLISYHDSQAEADTNTNPLPVNYNSTGYQKTIYVRLANASNPDCYDTISFLLNIYDTPTAPSVLDWWVCDDDNDGFFLFDLTEKTNEIATTFTSGPISFYETQTDAELGQNSISSPYTNTIRTQTLYFRVENGSNASCYDVGQFELQVFDTPSASPPADIIVCDVDETGSYLFDLTQQDSAILNGQDANEFEVLYFASEQDAVNNINLVSPTTYRNTSANQLIYARVHNPIFPDCFTTTNFTILVNPLPQIGLQNTYVICPDSPDLTIEAGLFESYDWRDGSGNSIGSGQNQFITELGNYDLTVTQTTNGLTCSNTHNFEVVSFGAPDSFTVSTSGISDQITLTVDAIGIGTFEYSIDGVIYQTENTFVVFPGHYTVYVRDPFECRTLNQNVIALGYEKFFTPNGDGFHELWNVIGAEQFPDSRLFIYDRYGKLLREISPTGPGWDGTYLGRLLPASDYWFRFEYSDYEVFTGHFTLKR